MRIRDIIGLLKEYIILGLITGVIFFIGYFIIYKKIMKGKKTFSKRKLLLYGVSICYMAIVFGAVFLSRGGMYGVANLHLFSSYKEGYHEMDMSLLRNNALNIMLFIPLGFLLPIYSDKFKKVYTAVPIGFLVTLAIEVIQYITKMGIFEVDDIFNNTFGTLIGYCIFMIFYNLIKKKNRKYIVGYIVPVIVAISVFLGMYIKYQNQELGNLAFEYNYKVNMKNVNVECKIDLPEKSENKTIYYTKVLTEAETRKIADTLFEKLGTEVSEDDIDLYDNTAIYYSKDRIYNTWIKYRGGTYSFTDFSQFNKKGEEKEDATKEEILEALNKLGVEIPENAEFKKDTKSYIFNVNMYIEENNLIDGTISCTYYKDGTIKNMQNNLLKYEKVSEKEIISPKDAYNQILEGKFRHVKYGYEKINSITVENFELKYVLDTKGYYVPAYVFKGKLNNEDTEIYIKAIKD